MEQLFYLTQTCINWLYCISRASNLQKNANWWLYNMFQIIQYNPFLSSFIFFEGKELIWPCYIFCFVFPVAPSREHRLQVAPTKSTQLARHRATLGIFFFSNKSSGQKRSFSGTPNCLSCSIRMVTRSCMLQNVAKTNSTLFEFVQKLAFGVSLESPVESATSSMGTELKQSVVIILDKNNK